MKLSLVNIPERLFLILKSFLFWVVFLLLLLFFGSLSNTLLHKNWSSALYGTIATIATSICTLLFIKLEKKTLFEYGLVLEKKTFVRFIGGLAIGTIIFSLIILLLLVFTELRMEKSKQVWEWKNLFWYLLIIPAAFMEELAFRSYTFINLNKVFGLRITQIIVAIAFAVYHILMGWDIGIAILGPGIWAIVFGLAAVWSKGIAVPTGIHVALNLIQQMIGLKTGDSEPIWLLHQSATASAASLSRTEMMGILSQVFVLVVAILFMEWYCRKIKAKVI